MRTPPPRVRTSTLAAVLCVVTALPFAASVGRAFVSSIWYEGADGYAEAVRRQAAENAPMLVYFRVDWCPYCRAFDRLLEDDEMRRGLAAALKVRVNPEHGEAERVLFEERFGGRGYPAICWVPVGGPPRRLSSAGPAAEFLAQLVE
jgi:thiol:disulfide interchange protein